MPASRLDGQPNVSFGPIAANNALLKVDGPAAVRGGRSEGYNPIRFAAQLTIRS